MFVHFQKKGRRLVASLRKSVRISDPPKVVGVYVCALGSIPLTMPVGERLVFWTLVEDRLSDHVGPDERAELVAAIRRRIPEPTHDELPALEEERGELLRRSYEALKKRQGLRRR